MTPVQLEYYTCTRLVVVPPSLYGAAVKPYSRRDRRQKAVLAGNYFSPGTVVPYPEWITYPPTYYVLGHACPSVLDEQATVTHAYNKHLLPYVLGHACMSFCRQRGSYSTIITSVEHARPTHECSLLDCDYQPMSSRNSYP